MAKFLTTTGVSDRLEQIINNANDRLVIISPFLKINKRIKELLEDRDRLKIDVRVVYGKNELQPEENIWLESMASIRTSFLEDLHAKCYLNEKEALVTSMNLYEYSQRNNYEMGIIVSIEEEPELYNSIREESNRIIRISQEIRVTVAKVDPVDDENEKVPEPERPVSRNALESGFCIRCRADLPVNPTQPYCGRCYASWKRYENEKYEEKHCHTCGNEHAATLLKPVCRTCHRKYKKVLEFPS